jgi:hypothetical protein
LWETLQRRLSEDEEKDQEAGSGYVGDVLVSTLMPNRKRTSTFSEIEALSSSSMRERLPLELERVELERDTLEVGPTATASAESTLITSPSDTAAATTAPPSAPPTASTIAATAKAAITTTTATATATTTTTATATAAITTTATPENHSTANKKQKRFVSAD